MSFTATIDIKEDFDIIYQALKPEEAATKRASWTIHKKDDACQVIVEAKDATAFRAMMSSITKGLALYEKAK